MHRIIVGNKVVDSKSESRIIFERLEKVLDLNKYNGEMMLCQGKKLEQPILFQGKFNSISIWGPTPRICLKFDNSFYYSFDNSKLKIFYFPNNSLNKEKNNLFPINYDDGKLVRLVDCRGNLLFEDNEEVSSWTKNFEKKLNSPLDGGGSFELLPGVFSLMNSYGLDYSEDLKNSVK